MEASTVLQIGLFFFLIQCACYYFYIPSTIKDTVNHDLPGYWDPINAEFNWCEYNYTKFFMIAEFWNTVTSLLYCIVSAEVFIKYFYKPLCSTKKTTFIVPYDIVIQCGIFFLIGVGSVAFHATLRYKWQLADELPMQWFTSAAAFSLFHRNLKTTNISIGLLTYGLTILTTVVLCTTYENKESLMHTIFRGVFIITFSGNFVYLAVACNIASKEVTKQIKRKYAKKGHVMAAERLFDWGIYCLVGGVMCWEADNFICPFLQNLPFGIPYINLHGFGWHVLTCMGVFYWFNVVYLHLLIVKSSLDVEVRWLLGGLIPVIEHED